MNAAFFQSHWALLGGLALLTLVATSLVPALYSRSAFGQLRNTRSVLKRAISEQEKIRRRVSDLEKQVARMSARGEFVKPRLLAEKKEQLDDARSLEKIAGDKTLVARNHVRRVIYEEYPPAKHDKLRNRFLPSESDAKPFTF